MKVLTLCVMALVMVQLITEGDAVCCHPPPPLSGSSGECQDCTMGTPFCGYGKCNIFGCNCDRGCRTGNCEGRKRSIVDAYDVIRAADVDEDGQMSLEEAHSYLADTGMPTYRFKRSLMELDANNDAFLSAQEID